MGRVRESKNGTHLVPPNDLDAERAVIGAVMVSAEAAGRVMEILKPHDFYSENNRIIYRAAINLYNANTPIDQITMTDELTRGGELEAVGGRMAVFKIIESVPTAANAVRYAKIVKSKAVLRGLIDAGSRITQSGFEAEIGEEGPDEALQKAEGLIYDLSREVAGGEGNGDALEHVGELYGEVIEQIQVAFESDGEMIGVPTGYRDLDRLTGGWKDGDMIVLGGRASMGKTSLALGCVEGAVEGGHHTAVFSLEMSRNQLLTRLLAKRTRTNLQDLIRGTFQEDLMSKLLKETAYQARWPLYVDGDPALTIAKMRSRLMKLQQKLMRKGERLELVVIDYLQLMTPDKRFDNRELEVASASRAMKLMAKELEVPMIVIVQLSRKVEDRNKFDRRPKLSDIRESGAIENDADVVLFVYRDEYYDPETEKRGIGEVLLRKHRNGPTGEVDLAWLESIAAFGDLAPEYASTSMGSYKADDDEW